MQIELGLVGAVAVMGAAVQLRILKVLQKKMAEIAEESKKQDEEAEGQAAARLSDLNRERDAWEKDHPTLSKHGRHDSSLPLLNSGSRDGSPAPAYDEKRQRSISGLSDFKVAPTSDEDLKRASRLNQTPGALPTLDLGIGIQEDVPSTFIANDPTHQISLTAAELEDFKRKQELLAEIQTIRRSIDVLKSETPGPSSAEQSRHPSITSRRTLSMEAGASLQPPNPHARPARGLDPRARVHSMELGTSYPNEPISRPTSVPLKDADWDAYIQERKLLQPPAGVSPPIATSPLSPGPSSRGPIAPAVQEALQRRKQRESALAASSDSSEDMPLARVVQHQHQKSTSSNAPLNILPPRRMSGAGIVAPAPQMPPRTRTFEELNERHREKMRDMQAPLTQAEKENAELEAARQRWERSKAMEKEAVTRRQAEKAAALEKRKKTGSPDIGPNDMARRRSSSADRLGGGGSSSKRMSTLKVEDWQRYQAAEGDPNPGSRRESRALSGASVPFPYDPKQGRRKSRDNLS